MERSLGHKELVAFTKNLFVLSKQILNIWTGQSESISDCHEQMAGGKKLIAPVWAAIGRIPNLNLI